ncbi:PREDICTED: uncharacterized protein LOC104785314 isoform X2 [Camelina sativa]|uniref:Uncharacterized protein LOC104785314 isoform X1 n=1 Tax=Camelina sativa TaxID=90675 RepID=A0ABM0Z0Q4_CAMSA|nr:PREDICTED: uncharacterized protein LOC104785314 isoform X1 [Camelina sativa]XP_019082646.1 PREDICTED: uncharacterized protein LOC104785314 isoform X2 [Camelina sativa]
MGNCLRHESEMHWAGEDWDEFIPEDHHHHHHSSKNTSRDAHQKVIVTRDCKSSDLSDHEMVKIRLTKKQLQDLLNKVNVHDFSCPSQMIDRGGYDEEGNQQGIWKPVLQSIPEAN